ncbi:hypothetical protein [Erwinia persicina]|uniref:Uncharacterized protein n=1 Tax=Erwinia persicina TaxID=55211 RepID=A0A4U3ESV9_9GAMM|nr:hypothetical protein [Erwinia persicina]MBD8109328.1 hypothetical protein [Erwinia persicina]MBD8170216.1 hypothetical protein [Erwinia persicina]MBD8212476.1 hypothetical protein [Erwinia persicina]TKJ82892.1 hypothetical protein EpCFBP13511_23435 [Erwinia persicina]
MADAPAWINFGTSALGGALAIAGGVVTQLLIARKESGANAKRLASDRAFIGSQAIVVLAEYRDICYEFSCNPGEEGRILYSRPGEPDFSEVKGDWTSLDGELLLRVHRLPLLRRQYGRELNEVLDKLSEVEYLPSAATLFRKLSDECDVLIELLMLKCNLPSPWILDETE